MATVSPGLCQRCGFARTVRGARSTFWRCGRADTDPAYPRYPTLPVLSCPGYAPGDAQPGTAPGMD